MIEPKSNSFLIGQDEAENFLLNAYKSSNLHNSYIFAGPKGIGKTTLAYKFARFLLSSTDEKKQEYTSLNVSPNSPIFKQIENNAYPDFKLIEKSFNKKDTDKLIKSIKDGKPMDDEEKQKLKKSSVIRIEEIRNAIDFLKKSSALGGYRVVIIDSIDDLNKSAANAVLKILEEPPQKTVLILISHNINSLLPTIKSRCAKLFLKPLEKEQTSSLLRRYKPELDEKDVKALCELSPESIGKAIDFANFDVVNQNELLQKIIYAKDKFLLADLLKFAEYVSKDEDTFEFGFEIILKFLSDNVKSFENVDELSGLYFKANQIYRDCVSLNIDKKQAVINIVNQIVRYF